MYGEILRGGSWRNRNGGLGDGEMAGRVGHVLERRGYMIWSAVICDSGSWVAGLWDGFGSRK